jgi:DNA-directed RNA polymerase specialized sigma24 family protein
MLGSRLGDAVDPSVSTWSLDFADAVRMYSRALKRLAFLLTGDVGKAEDIVAKAYARVWPKYRDDRVEGLGPYLRRAVVNVAIGINSFTDRRARHQNRKDKTDGFPWRSKRRPANVEGMGGKMRWHGRGWRTGCVRFCA